MKKHSKSGILFLTVFAAHLHCFAASSVFTAETFLDIARKHKIDASQLGVKATIGEGVDQQTLVELNSTRKMIPASITKVVTASAVLEAIQPGTKIKTKLLTTGSVKGDSLKGDLILKGGGDPSFVSENMWFLVNAFLRTGIKKIEGNIVVDDSLFDSKRYDDSRQKERVDRAYDAPVGAMSFNWNSVNIFVRPNDKAGEPAQVFIDPQNDYIQLVNKAGTQKGSANSLIADRRELKKGDQIVVSGKLGENSPEVVVFKNITNPDLWAGENLKSFLKQRGVEVKGDVRAGVSSGDVRTLAESESKPIEHMVSDMNKFSNNYVAEMLTKLMVAIRGKTPANLSDGMVMINDHMKSLKVPVGEYELFNPSGLTRDNLMSANAVWMVLKHLRNDFRVQPEFLTSLPIAGIDGTLKRRMKNGPAERWVRAKTGFLTGVITLAGYAGLEDGQVITFTFIYNGGGDDSRVRAFYDEVLEKMIR